MRFTPEFSILDIKKDENLTLRSELSFVKYLTMIEFLILGIWGIFEYIRVYLGIFGYIFGYIWVYSRTSAYIPSKFYPN